MLAENKNNIRQPVGFKKKGLMKLKRQLKETFGKRFTVLKSLVFCKTA